MAGGIVEELFAQKLVNKREGLDLDGSPDVGVKDVADLSLYFFAKRGDGMAILEEE